jgi:hypothetical protein
VHFVDHEPFVTVGTLRHEIITALVAVPAPSVRTLRHTFPRENFVAGCADFVFRIEIRFRYGFDDFSSVRVDQVEGDNVAIVGVCIVIKHSFAPFLNVFDFFLA